jgi:FtsH-binding integral membrane protein
MSISQLTNVFLSNQWSQVSRAFSTSFAPWSSLILAASTTALVGLGAYHWSQPQASATAQQNNSFENVRRRVILAYKYVFGGFALTATAAVASHISGLSLRLLHNSYLAIPITLGSFAALVATINIKKEDYKTKHIAWAIFNVGIGMLISPIGFLNQRIVAQAAAIALTLGTGLTLSAFLAPREKFLSWQGPLMVTLTSISLASSIALFFPGTAFAYGVDRASLYGGLIVFSGLLMSSTQRLIKEAKEHAFDPIKSSMLIYLDGMNIFLRILAIMDEKTDREEKKTRQV